MLDKILQTYNEVGARARNVRPSSRGTPQNKHQPPRKVIEAEVQQIRLRKRILSTEAFGDHFQIAEINLILEVSLASSPVCDKSHLDHNHIAFMTFSLSRVYLPRTKCLGLRPARRDIPGSIVTC